MNENRGGWGRGETRFGMLSVNRTQGPLKDRNSNPTITQHTHPKHTLTRSTETQSLRRDHDLSPVAGVIATEAVDRGVVGAPTTCFHLIGGIHRVGGLRFGLRSNPGKPQQEQPAHNHKRDRQSTQRHPVSPASLRWIGVIALRLGKVNRCAQDASRVSQSAGPVANRSPSDRSQSAEQPRQKRPFLPSTKSFTQKHRSVSRKRF